MELHKILANYLNQTECTVRVIKSAYANRDYALTKEELTQLDKIHNHITDSQQLLKNMRRKYEYTEKTD